MIIYRFPSQSQDELETFSDNFEMTLETLAQKGSFVMTIISGFNAKSSNWYSHDKMTFEGSTTESIMFQFRLDQLINEPTNLLQNCSLCINLILTSQPNIVVQSGVHPSLHPNCHHQTVFTKFDFKIFYPLPYLREVWHYKKQVLILSNEQLTTSTGKKLFLTLILIRKFLVLAKQPSTFSITIFHIKTVICNDKDPPLFNFRIKSLIENENKFRKI